MSSGRDIKAFLRKAGRTFDDESKVSESLALTGQHAGWQGVELFVMFWATFNIFLFLVFFLL